MSVTSLPRILLARPRLSPIERYLLFVLLRMLRTLVLTVAAAALAIVIFVSVAILFCGVCEWLLASGW